MLNGQSKSSQYPRPQFERADWVNLNGAWNFEFDDQNLGEQEDWFEKKSFSRQIAVPFVYECSASGIGDTEHHENVWYEKNVVIPQSKNGRRVLLNFQGVDYSAKVWVNGRFAGEHKGANTAFHFDITGCVAFGSVNRIVVKAEDSKSCCQPRGKQRWVGHSFACWYIQSTGIWKTVWMEFVEETHISSVKITPDVERQSVAFEYSFSGLGGRENLSHKTGIFFDDRKVREFDFAVSQDSMNYISDLSDDSFVQKVQLWTPEEPNLYRVRFTLMCGEKVLDEVDSYFGMRQIAIQDGKVFLNGRELYQKLVLEQGYWPETMLTPPSDEAVCKEIDCILKMGFNGIRLHQKIEDDRFLYFCDRKGLLVWSEMAATYVFSDQAVDNFTREWLEIVRQQYNHPCIITWTPFNESWGIPGVLLDKKQQAFTEAIYYLTKAMDPMRPVITNDGWEHTISDIVTIHDYEGDAAALSARYADKEKFTQEGAMSGNGRRLMADGFAYRGQPIVISEFGGMAMPGRTDQDDGWGYGKDAKNEEKFLKRYAGLLRVIKAQGSVVGFCYTQLTDVQQEQNGLYTQGRVSKVDPAKIREANRL